MTKAKAKFTLSLSEAQWDLYPEQANDDASLATFELPCPEGAWVQFTYEGLRDPDGAFADLWFGDDGFWHHDGRVFSDVTIEFVEG